MRLLGWLMRNGQAPACWEAASILGKRGAQVRKQRRTAKVHAIARQLRAECGLPPSEIFNG